MNIFVEHLVLFSIISDIFNRKYYSENLLINQNIRWDIYLKMNF